MHPSIHVTHTCIYTLQAGGETTVTTAKRHREDDAMLGKEVRSGVGSGGGSTHVEVKPDTTETEPDTTMATSTPHPPAKN